MADQHIDTASIGPQLSLDDVTLPEAVGEQMATLLLGEGRIDTGTEWVTAMGTALADSGRRPTIEDLCTTDDGRHTFEGGGESQSYICVLDPLIYPFLTDTPGAVRSETPVREETVEIGIDEDGATVSHDDAIVSLGVSDHVDAVEAVTPEVVYRQVCGHIHVFADREEYETWATDTDAATTAMPVDEGIAVSRELATALFG